MFHIPPIKKCRPRATGAPDSHLPSKGQGYTVRVSSDSTLMPRMLMLRSTLSDILLSGPYSTSQLSTPLLIQDTPVGGGCQGLYLKVYLLLTIIIS